MLADLDLGASRLFSKIEFKIAILDLVSYMEDN